jgi:hypothetical protein
VSGYTPTRATHASERYLLHLTFIQGWATDRHSHLLPRPPGTTDTSSSSATAVGLSTEIYAASGALAVFTSVDLMCSQLANSGLNAQARWASYWLQMCMQRVK